MCRFTIYQVAKNINSKLMLPRCYDHLASSSCTSCFYDAMRVRQTRLLVMMLSSSRFRQTRHHDASCSDLFRTNVISTDAPTCLHTPWNLTFQSALSTHRNRLLNNAPESHHIQCNMRLRNMRCIIWNKHAHCCSCMLPWNFTSSIGLQNTTNTTNMRDVIVWWFLCNNIARMGLQSKQPHEMHDESLIVWRFFVTTLQGGSKQSRR